MVKYLVIENEYFASMKLIKLVSAVRSDYKPAFCWSQWRMRWNCLGRARILTLYSWMWNWWTATVSIY